MDDSQAVRNRRKPGPRPPGMYDYLLLLFLTCVTGGLLCLLIYRDGYNSPAGWVLAVILFMPMSLICMRILPRYHTVLQMLFKLLHALINSWKNRRR